MGRPTGVTRGNESAGIRLEYVRKRGVVRVLAWRGGRPVVEPLELPLGTLFRRLRIDGGELAGSQRYLLFSGSHPAPEGAAGSFLAAFDGEEEARAAFDEIRRSRQARTAPAGGWAELVALDAAGKLRRLCWVGTVWGNSPPVPRDAGSAPPPRAASVRRRRFSRGPHPADAESAARRRRETVHLR